MHCRLDFLPHFPSYFRPHCLPKCLLKCLPKCLLFGLLLSSSAFIVSAQPMQEEFPVHYAVENRVIMYSPADSAREYLHLKFREPLHMVNPGPQWSLVRTLDGANGVVRSEQISNIWIRISKEQQTLFVYRGSVLIARYATDLGYNFFADKERRGTAAEPDHWRTPEGEFYVVSKNSVSEFYRALVLNYPNGEDARRGRDEELITEAQYEAIVQADRSFEMPPMNTDLGGWIEIHGDGTGLRSNWTHGCIAIQNDQIDRLWDLVSIGTPVLIDS